MHKIEIPEINFKKEIPENIREMNSDEYLHMLSQMLLWQQKIINVNDFKTRLIINLLDIKITPTYMAMTEDERLQIDSNIFYLSQLIDTYFITEERETPEGKIKVKVLDLYTHKNFLPEIKIKGTKFYGPDDALTNITFIEYIHAHEHSAEYVRTNNEESLNKLCATLYRPEIFDYETARLKPDYNGQRRIKYNPNTVDDRAFFMAQLPQHYKHAIFLFFKNSEQYFSTEELTVAGNIISLQKLFSKQSQTDEFTESRDDIGWLSILYSVAESGTFGNIEETSQQNLYDILLYLYNNKKQFDDFKFKNK